MGSELVIILSCRQIWWILQNGNHWEAWPTWELQIRRDSVSEIKGDSV